MRKSNLFIALAMTATALSMGACSNDEVEVVDLNKPIDVLPTISAPQTRTTITDGTTALETGDEVGVYMMMDNQATAGDVAFSTDEAIAIRANVKYTHSGNWADKFYWQNTEYIHTFYAYYPYSGSGVSVNTAYTLPTSYANADEYKAADWMWGKASHIAQNAPVKIQLSHSLAQIVVTFGKGDGYDGNQDLPEVAKIEVLNADKIKTMASFSIETGEMTGATATDATAIETWKEANKYYALVLPGQKFADNANFIKVTTTDGTEYLYNLALANDQNLTIEANHVYTFNLKLNREQLQLASFEINPWTEGSGDTDGNADMVVPAN